MKWVTWDEAAIALLLCTALVVGLRRVRPNRLTRVVVPAIRELGFVSGIYMIWRLARQLPFKQESEALDYARSIARLQDWLRLPSELSLQHFVMDHDWLARLTVLYYWSVHVPALLIFLVWMFFRHREDYWRWRTALAFLTAFCLVLRFIRVAPPRFLPELGFVDLSTRYGISSYGSVGSGVSDQFAAMPSIHIAWAAVVSLGVFSATASHWRWPVLMHLPVTFFVVAATGHHWWADGVVALGLLGIGLGLDTLGRTRWPSSSSRVGGFSRLVGGREEPTKDPLAAS